MDQPGRVLLGILVLMGVAFVAGRSYGGDGTVPASSTPTVVVTERAPGVTVTSTIPVRVAVPDPDMQDQLDEATRAAEEAQESADAAIQAKQLACDSARREASMKAMELEAAARELESKASGFGWNSVDDPNVAMSLRDQARDLRLQAMSLRSISC